MNKEYTRIGDKVFVRDEEGHLSEREYSDYIEEILKIENRIDALKNTINDTKVTMETEEKNIKSKHSMEINSRVFFGVLISSILFLVTKNMLFEIGFISAMASATIIKYFQNKKTMKKEFGILKKTYESFIMQMEKKKKREEENLEKIKNKSKDISKNKVIKNSTIEINDNIYYKELMSRLIFTYLIEKLRDKDKKIADQFLEQIHCNDEDKKIYFDMLNNESETKENHHKSKEDTKSKPNIKEKR